MSHNIERTSVEEEMCEVSECKFKKVEGSDYCPIHIARQRSHDLKLYRLKRAKARIRRLAYDGRARSLKEEIALLRYMIEEKFNSIETDSDLFIATPMLSDLITKVSNLVNNSVKIDAALNELVDRDILNAVLDRVVEIITRYIDDEDILEHIANEISSITVKIDGGE